MPKPPGSKPKRSGKSTPPVPVESCEAYTSEGFEKDAAKLDLTPEQRGSLEGAIKKVAQSFGHPHQHAGLGLRDLGHGIYECRWAGAGKGGLHLRLIFKRLSKRPTVLFFDMIGNHDEVRKYLKR